MRIIIILSCIFFFACGNEPKRGIFGRVGITMGDFTHTAGKSTGESLFSSLYLHLGYTFANQIQISSELNLGASVGDLLSGSPLVGLNSLTTLDAPKGGLNLVLEDITRVGYNLISRPFDSPLYLGSGLLTRLYTNGQANMPLVPTITATYLPLEIGGKLALNSKWRLEYLVAYDLLLFASTQVSGQIKEPQNLSIKKGYALRASLGFTYHFSTKFFFHTTAVLQYENLGASSQESVTIIDTSTPGAIVGATSTIYYPQNHTTYAGVRFGFGF